MIRSGPYGDQFGHREGISLQAIKDHPQASMDLGPLQQRLPGMLRTPSKRMDLMHEAFANDLPRLQQRFVERSGQNLEADSSNDMLLIGRRHVRDMNSWLHNLKPYVRGSNRCTAKVNPADAERLGLTHEADVRVVSSVGEAVIPIEISDEMMPGVVSIPHGFGHVYQASKQSNALSISPGISCNNLIDESLDEASSTCLVNGVPVKLFAV